MACAPGLNIDSSDTVHGSAGLFARAAVTEEVRHGVARRKAGPSPTRDLAEAMRDLAEFGACVVLDALDAETLAEVHTALYRAADSDRKYGIARDYAYAATIMSTSASGTCRATIRYSGR